jgi:hypothetical protein
MVAIPSQPPIFRAATVGERRGMRQSNAFGKPLRSGSSPPRLTALLFRRPVRPASTCGSHRSLIFLNNHIVEGPCRPLRQWRIHVICLHNHMYGDRTTSAQLLRRFDGRKTGRVTARGETPRRVGDRNSCVVDHKRRIKVEFIALPTCSSSANGVA